MTQDITGRLVRRAVDLRRYENGLADRVVKVLLDARDDILAQLMKLDPTLKDGGFQRRRLQALLRQIDDTLKTAYRDVGTLASRELRDLAEVQAEAARGDLTAMIGNADISTVAIGADRLRAIVDTSPIQGFPMADWWRTQRTQTARLFEQQLRIGLVQSETIDQLVMRIRGRAVGRGRYVGGIMQTTTRNAETLVRTAANQVANEAQQLTMAKNVDIAPRYRYLATLDDRTTPICRALDGQEFKVEDTGAPRPPQHWGCRSTTVPIVDWKGLGLEPPPESTRASKDGPVPSGLTYEEWLKGRSATEQNAILGPSRAKLFRDGTASLRDLVASDGRQYTLEELRQRLS